MTHVIDQALSERFTNPPSEYGPTPLWWWSGGTVTEEGIDWQLRRFADGGILNVVLMNLAPKGPTYGAMPDDPVWFSERWWELFRFLCERSAELGVAVWFYDQIGFSGANLQGMITAKHPEAAGRSLRSRLTQTTTDGALELEPREHVIGVFDAQPDENGAWLRLDLDGDSSSERSRIERLPAGRSVRIVSWRESSFDYLNVDAVARLIDFVHGEFERRIPEHLGSTVVGSFQDELPAMPTWSAGFIERFRAEAGYDLVPVLPALWDHTHEDSARVRADYHRVRTMLAEEAFFRPLGQWHRDRGMLLGADQMNPARAGVPTQSVQLYGDYYTTHRWFDAVGSDHEGDARIHSSMADLYDHPRVWIESFHSSGWGGTLEDTWDWLIPFLRSGANLYNPHASYYGLQAGWFEWAPPSTDFRQPYYEVYPAFAKAVARVCALSTWGRHAVDVAVLYPSVSIQAALPPDLPIDHFLDGDIGPEHPGVDRSQRAYMQLVGKNDWFRSDPGELDRAGIDFDIIDDDSLIRAEAREGSAHVNGFEFATVILPEIERISAAVAERLIELLDAGGRVIAVGRAPEHAAGSADADDGDQRDARVRQLAAHPQLQVVADAEAAVGVLDACAQFAWSPYGVRAQRDGNVGLALVPGAFPNATAYPLRTGIGAGGWDDVDFDADRYAARQDLEVAGVVVEAELWNPATGTQVPAEHRFNSETGTSTIAVTSGGAPLLIAVWRTADGMHEAPVGANTESAREHRAVDSPATETEEIPAQWTQELVSTLDNRWGDFALPASTEPIPLELWQLDLLERDERTPVRVTFGQEVVVSDPYDSTEAPQPIDTASAERMRNGAPLADESWSVQRYSARDGRDGQTGVRQDPKGFIAEEFLVHQTPPPGKQVSIRALVRVEKAGDYDFTVSSALAASASLDGVPVALSAGGYDATAPVHFANRVGVLEIRLAEPTGTDDDRPQRRERMTASFSLHHAGQSVARPEFMAAGEDGLENGTAAFRTSFSLEQSGPATIVTGAPCALTVLLDGEAVARQEKVEYYESGLGDNPMYFTHEIGTVAAGSHTIEVVTEGVTSNTPLFVDLVIAGSSGLVAVPSGTDWTVGSGNTGSGDTAVTLVAALSGGTTHARAARRPHPLAAAHWLSGPPEVGSTAVPFETASSATPSAQTFEALIPAGTVSIDLSADVERVFIDGRNVSVVDRTATLDAPTAEPSTLQVSVPERAFSRSGAVWDGPIVVHTQAAPAVFGEWSEQGLASWSGAVRYSTTITVAEGERIRLDLGRVRGAVTIDLDGDRVASAFCAPFAFELCELADLSGGEHAIAVTVYGTLAPRYASATQSTFFVPSQLRTGIAGPITLKRKQFTGGL